MYIDYQRIVFSLGMKQKDENRSKGYTLPFKGRVIIYRVGLFVFIF